MATIRKRTFSLPPQHAKFIDSKVASDAYASGSEVVRAGLCALQERDAAVERWLRNEVAPVFDAMKKNPTRAVSARQVFAGVEARYATRAKPARHAKA